jgi:hypothetical protein
MRLRCRKPKPPVKPPVLGTSQLAGNDGVVGTEYTIGKDNPMNIAVTKVEYRADRVRTGDEVASPTASEKLLVVRFAFHNPNKQESRVRSDTFRFTAVDTAGTNHDYEAGVWQEVNGEVLDISLKPGQKIGGFCHLYSGQEAIAVGIASMFQKGKDYLITGYRCHGHSLALGMDPRAGFAELFGKETGCAKG